MVGVGSYSKRMIGGGGRTACEALPLFLLLLDEPRCFQQRFQAHPDVAGSLHDELCFSLRSFGRLRLCDRTVDSRRRLPRTKKSRARSRVSTLLFFCCCQPRVAIGMPRLYSGHNGNTLEPTFTVEINFLQEFLRYYCCQTCDTCGKSRGTRKFFNSGRSHNVL